MVEEIKKEKKMLTVRGIDPEVYERFTKVASELGTNVGELMNEAMKIFLSLVEIGEEKGEKVGKQVGKVGAKLISAPLKVAGSVIEGAKNFDIITGVSELEITKMDLESIEKPVLFINIHKLVFEDDVTWDVLNSKVRSIKIVDEVVIPKHIPKLLLAKKCMMVKRIVARQ